MCDRSGFKNQFLHPKYWLTWFGLAFLWLLVQFPYPVIRMMGFRAGKLSRPFLKRREAIARKNIALCFPHLTADDIERLVADYHRD